MLKCYGHAIASCIVLSIVLLASTPLLGDQPSAAPQLLPKPASSQAQLLVSKRLSELAEDSAASIGNFTHNGPAAIEATRLYSIEFDGKSFTVAHVTVVGLRRFSFVVVFDSLSGDAVFSSIDAFPTATDVVITSLGTESDWFIWLQAWNTGLSNGSPLHRRSSVVPIDGEFLCAFTANHFANDSAWTSTPEQAKAVGANGIFFTCKDRQTAIPDHRAKDASGNTVIPALLWDTQQRKFGGPKIAMMNDATVMEVVTRESKHYLETSTDSLANLIPTDSASD